MEARDLVRRAVGDAAGLTIKAQVRQAARHLGFPAESWRPREAFYGRAGGWSAAALDDLRQRFAAWLAREAATPSTLAQRVGEVRRLLAEAGDDASDLVGLVRSYVAEREADDVDTLAWDVVGTVLAAAPRS